MHCHLTAIFDAWHVWCFLWSQLTACELRLRSTSGYHFRSESVVSIVMGKTTLASGSLIDILFSTSFMVARILCLGNVCVSIGHFITRATFICLSEMSSLAVVKLLYLSVQECCLRAFIAETHLSLVMGNHFIYVTRVCSFRSRVSKAELIAVYSLCTWAKLHS